MLKTDNCGLRHFFRELNLFSSELKIRGGQKGLRILLEGDAKVDENKFEAKLETAM